MDNDKPKEKEEEMVVCPVCGTANAKGNGLCYMCSNYLFENSEEGE